MTSARLPRGLGRARPVLGAVLLAHAYAVGSSWLIALPVLNATAASGISQFPEPARQLFQDGGLWLLELAREQQASLRASLLPGAWLLGLLAFGSIVPEWWLLTVLARQRAGAAPSSARASLRRLCALGLAAWLLRALCWALGLGLGVPLHARLERWPDERAADLCLLGLLGLLVLLQLGLSLGRDALAASIVSAQLSLRAGLAHAARAARRHAGKGAALYAAVRLASLGLLIGGELLAVALDGTNGIDPGAGFAAHQLSLLLRTSLHAAWLYWLVQRLAQPPGTHADAFL
jgi:hypothetical protein